jgi:hypothetical protein
VGAGETEAVREGEARSQKVRLETVAALLRLEGDEANRLSRVVNRLNASIEAFRQRKAITPRYMFQRLPDALELVEQGRDFQIVFDPEITHKAIRKSSYLGFLVGSVRTTGPEKVAIGACIYTKGNVLR